MPAFGPMAVRDMFDEMHDIASQLVLKFARMGPDYRIPVTDDFTRLTLDTIALCAMDYRFNSFYQDDMHPFVQAMINVLSAGADRQRIPAVVQKFMWSKNEQIKADSKFQFDLAAELVRHRRENPTEKKDLLHNMIYGKDPKTGETMRDDLIAANMITFLIAGHETTSGLLSFAFHNMLKNPSTYFKAQQEVDRVVGKGNLTVDHLKDLKYINAILRETLRLTPTAPAFTRKVRDENHENPPTLGKGEYELKKEWGMLCLIGKIQRDPKVYGDDAEEFKPERMMDEEFEKLPKGAWKPFGTGMRACIGRPFAWQEALLVMAILLQNFDFRMDDPSYQLKVKSTLTIKPQGFYMRSSLRPGITATSLQHKFAGSADHVKASTNSDPAPVAGSSSGRPMTILYGSNTGTCQSFAQKLASDARTHGFNATVKDLDAGVNGLPTDAPTVIITASYEGLPPDNAAQFVAWLDAIKGEQALKGVKYAVFGCGHKDWSSTFHRIPRLVDTTVGQLGGERLVEIGTTDASQGDMFSGFDNWCEAFLWPAISAKFGSDFSADQPRKGIDMEISTKTRASQLQHDVKQGKVLVAKTLTAPGEPEKRHLEIELPDGMEYDAGDYLVVLPNNPDDSIHRVLSKYSIPFDAVITIKDGGPVTLPAGKSVSALDLLKGYVELSLPATKKDIQICTEFTADVATLEKLIDLSGPNYHTEIITKRTSLLDLLELYPKIELPFPEFLAMLPPMRPRYYSISSSPLNSATRCSITYGVIDSTSLSGKGKFQGVSGSYLRSLRPGDAMQVNVRPATAAFHLPASRYTTPIMMFCNGTGLAPFRSFLQERAAQTHANPQRKLAPALLFIGCRSPTGDSLYAKELADWARAGVVDIRYAYSREPDHPDSAGCKYVQDRMLKDKKDVLTFWKAGAKVYLCGSPGMVEGIKSTARALISERCDAPPEDIEGFFKSMRNERIAVDVFA